MNGKKAKHVRKLLASGNKELLKALTKRHGEEVLNESFKSLFKKAKKLFKDVKANRPI
jgi:hypothetical protein